MTTNNQIQNLLMSCESSGKTLVYSENEIKFQISENRN